MQRQNKNQESLLRGESGEAIRRLAGSGDAHRRGGHAALQGRGAAGGPGRGQRGCQPTDGDDEPAYEHPGGARLVERISRQAKESGLT